MKKLQKSFWLSFVLLLNIALLAACGGEDASTDDQNGDSETSEETNDNDGDSEAAGGEPVTIEFWAWWGSGSRETVIEQIIEDFNAMQDDIIVEYVYQPWGDIWTKSLAAVAAGNPPDIVMQDINSVRQRADANQAMNLQQFIDEEDEDIQARFYPQLWDTVIHDGDPYALPFNTDTHVLFYNKDKFEESGLDPDSPPATWDELEEYALALDDNDGDNWNTIGFYPLWNLGPDIWSINADSGTGWFDSEGNVTINTPEKVEALEWVVDYQDHIGRDTINRYEAEFGSGVADPFISGLLGMRGQNINYFVNIMENAEEDFNFGVAPIPEKTSGSGNHTWGGGFVAEIPYGAAHPEESWEFIKYLTDVQTQQYFGVNSFDIMANEDANEGLASHSELSESGQMIYELAHENLDDTVLTPVPLEAPDYLSLLNSHIDEALLGRKSPQEALDEAQDDVEDLVEQNQ